MVHGKYIGLKKELWSLDEKPLFFKRDTCGSYLLMPWVCNLHQILAPSYHSNVHILRTKVKMVFFEMARTFFKIPVKSKINYFLGNGWLKSVIFDKLGVFKNGQYV